MPVIRNLSIALVLLTVSLANNAFAGEITFDIKSSSLDINIAGKPFATYVWQDELIPRPYFKQIHAPNENQVTRPYPTDPVLNKDNDDHATYHPGIWLAFGDINGHDFWRNKARVRNVRFVSKPVVENSIGHFKVLNVYESAGPEHKAVCVEQCTYEFRDTPFGFLMTMRSSFRNLSYDFAFGDQEEMGLGIRLATALTVRYGNGKILNSEGGTDEKGTWGKQADWCAYSGSIKGKTTGVMLIPHPGNFRKSWYHSRDYGLLTANPFGKKAMTTPDDQSVENDSTPVPRGERLTLGFSVLLFGKDINYDEAYREVLDTIR
jgi:hypothetical protein